MTYRQLLRNLKELPKNLLDRQVSIALFDKEQPDEICLYNLHDCVFADDAMFSEVCEGNIVEEYFDDKCDQPVLVIKV